MGHQRSDRPARFFAKCGSRRRGSPGSSTRRSLYTQVDRAARQTFDVVEGIENTLTMLRHRLGNDIRVVRRYDEGLPLIDGYPGALNQVWTNLIGNAIDAMDGNGTLTISVQAERRHR